MMKKQLKLEDEMGRKIIRVGERNEDKIIEVGGILQVVNERV